MQSHRVAMLGVAFALSTSSALSGGTVSHKQLGLRVTAPDGFEPDPSQVKGDVACAFVRPSAGDRAVGTAVLVTRLGGVIGREPLSPEQFAAKNLRVTIETAKWKGFDVQVIRTPEPAGEAQTVAFAAQVPLTPEAVQVTVFGDTRDEQELRGILRDVLGNLEGNTNWLTDAQRSDRLASGIARLIVSSSFAVVIIGVVVWQVVRRFKKTDKGRRRRNSSPRRPPREADDPEGEDGEDRGRSSRRRRGWDEDDEGDEPRRRRRD